MSKNELERVKNKFSAVENMTAFNSPILKVDKRVQRKKIQAEIVRLNNLILYSKCDADERNYIKLIIDKLQNELGVYR